MASEFAATFSMNGSRRRWVCCARSSARVSISSSLRRMAPLVASMPSMRLPIAARCCLHSPQVTYGPTRSVSSGCGTVGLPYFALIHAPAIPAIAETAAPPIVKLTPSTSIQAPYFA